MLVVIGMWLLIAAPNDLDVSLQGVSMLCALQQPDVAVEKVDFADYEGNVSVDVLRRVAAFLEQEVLEEGKEHFLMIMEVYFSHKSSHPFLS